MLTAKGCTKGGDSQRRRNSILDFEIFRLERVAGVEPASQPWEGRIIAVIRYPQMTAIFDEQYNTKQGPPFLMETPVA